MKYLLTVCTGNICRSPMVYGLLHAKVSRSGLSQELLICSAGTHAKPNEPASRSSVDLLLRRGVSITDHLAEPVSEQSLEQADLIIVMEESHRKYLINVAPQTIPKTILLSELVYEQKDIPDPFGKPIEVYDAVLSQIDRYIEQGWPALLRRLDIEP